MFTRKLAPVLLALYFFLLGPLRGADQAPVKEVVFAAYNVENYLVMDRFDGHKTQKGAGKPEKEVQALIRVIKDISPDILGVSEMGPPEQFSDFLKRLHQAGLDYPHTEFVQAADETRHVVLASKFPILARQSLTDLSFELNGVRQPVQRGFLDVTIQITPDYQLRLVGVHLKSKRPVPAGEALLRRNEAQLLRRHVESILDKAPNTNLLLYGDCNDTKNEPPIREIMGTKRTSKYMADLWLKDELGDRWTHYWKTADQYSRLDYIFVSPSLFREVDLSKCRVYRSPYWNDASDHRPVVATIVPVDKR